MEKEKQFDLRLGAVILPAVVAGFLFELFVGHRHDYTGHFVAGYGGTLGALMVSLKAIPDSTYERFGAMSVCGMCLVCIALGAFTEATAFRIAKFDEIDFCNQSLGAVLASAATLSYLGSAKPVEQLFDSGLIAAIVILSV